jgi:hypothetical protein
MKLLFLLLLPLTLAAQGQLADVKFKQQTVNGTTYSTIEEIYKIWSSRKDVNAVNGMTYTWTLNDDTARYFIPPVGVALKATVTFSPVSGSGTLALKEILDNTAAVYRFADGSTANPAMNVFNTTVWNNFDNDFPPASGQPAPSWCNVFYNKSAHFAWTTNLTATYTFTGKKLKIFGEKSDNKGIIGFKIDGGTEQLIDLYAATVVNNTQLIFETPTLSQGTHTVVARIVGTKNAASSATNLLIDDAEVWE